MYKMLLKWMIMDSIRQVYLDVVVKKMLYGVRKVYGDVMKKYIECYDRNKDKNDLGLVVSDVLCDTAAVYTSNKVKVYNLDIMIRSTEVPHQLNKKTAIAHLRGSRIFLLI